MHKLKATNRVAAGLACLSMLGPFAVDAYLPAYPEIVHDLGISLASVQQTLTCYLLTFAIMNLFHGVLSDAVGRRPIVLAGLALFSCASLGCAMARDAQMLFIFRVLQGASAGAGVITVHAIVRDCFDGFVARRMVSAGAVTYAIAPAAAPIIGGYLLIRLGWRSIFVFLAMLAAVLFVAAWRNLPETHPKNLRVPFDVKSIIGSYKRILPQRSFLYLTTITSCNFGAGFLYIASAPIFIRHDLGLSSGSMGWLFLPLVGGNVAGALVAGRVAKHWSPHTTIARGFQIMAIAAICNVILCSAMRPQLPWSVIPLFAYALGTAIAAPSLIMLLLDHFPTLRGTTSSLRWFAQNALLAVIAGAISPCVAASTERLAATMLGMLTVSMCCWMVFKRRESRAADSKANQSSGLVASHRQIVQ